MPPVLLHQGSASAISEQAASRPVKNRDDGYADSGSSRYQDVSREHTQTLARQDQAKNRSADQQAAAKDTEASAHKADLMDKNVASSRAAGAAKKAAGADAGNQASLDNAGKVNEPQSDNAESEAITYSPNNFAESTDIADLPGTEPVAFTFMELQAMLAPMSSPPVAAAGVINNSASAALAGATLAAGIAGQPLNSSAAPGLFKAGIESANNGLSAGQAAGLTFTDTLRNGESLRPVDGVNLVADSRLQGSADNLLQQPSSSARVPADPALTLRGYTTSVDVPVGQAEWGDKVMGKLSWLTARNMSMAEIHLSPADLGPLEVKVRMHNDQASITVHAANPMVRDQLEQHSHRLRDMLGEQGVSLERFDVSDQSRQQSGEQSNAEAGNNGGRGSRGGDGPASGTGAQDAILTAGQLDLSWRGEVDVFA